MTEGVPQVRTTPIDVPHPPVAEPEEAQWQQIHIPLTDEQTAALRKLGVDTSEIIIQTFDISRLGGILPN